MGNTYCSLEISSRNEKPIYNLLILEKRKNQLVFNNVGRILQVYGLK